MVLPAPPYVLQGGAAIGAVSDTSRWDGIDLSDGHIVRPQEGLIVMPITRARHGTTVTAMMRTAPRPTAGSAATNGVLCSTSKRWQ